MAIRLTPAATRPPDPALRRRVFATGAVTAIVAAVVPLAIGSTVAQAALAPGTPLKTERVRCHNLVWQSRLPAWVSALPANQVQAAMETHITTEATHYKGDCYAWDVVNEPFNSDGSFVADPFFNAMGSGYIADALKTAHAADPATRRSPATSTAASPRPARRRPSPTPATTAPSRPEPASRTASRAPGLATTPTRRASPSTAPPVTKGHRPFKS